MKAPIYRDHVFKICPFWRQFRLSTLFSRNLRIEPSCSVVSTTCDWPTAQFVQSQVLLATVEPVTQSQVWSCDWAIFCSNNSVESWSYDWNLFSRKYTFDWTNLPHNFNFHVFSSFDWHQSLLCPNNLPLRLMPNHLVWLGLQSSESSVRMLLNLQFFTAVWEPHSRRKIRLQTVDQAASNPSFIGRSSTEPFLRLSS